MLSSNLRLLSITNMTIETDPHLEALRAAYIECKEGGSNGKDSSGTRNTPLCPLACAQPVIPFQHYEHMWKANAPPAAPTKPTAHSGKKAVPPAYSHYLQSKVFRARERIEAEQKALASEVEPPLPKQPEAPSATPPSENGKSS